jgi:ankyrin repeat protein
MTALMCAAGEGHTETVKFLLASGADIDTKTETGNTAAEFAAFKGHTETVELLKEWERKDDNKSASAAEKKAGMSIDKLIDYLAAHPEDEDFIWLSSRMAQKLEDVFYSRPELIKKTIRTFGDDPMVARFDMIKDTVQPSDITLLITNLIPGFLARHAKTVKFQPVKGVGANAAGTDSEAAMMQAAGKGDIETVKLLLANGVNINATDRNGKTALLYASEHGHTETVKMLLKAAAIANITDGEGRTALICASAGGHSETVKFLLVKGAKVNAKDKNGRTALEFASVGGHAETVKLLEAKGGVI